MSGFDLGVGFAQIQGHHRPIRSVRRGCHSNQISEHFHDRGDNYFVT